MNTDLVLTLLEEIAHLKAQIQQLYKQLPYTNLEIEEDDFEKDKIKMFEDLLIKFQDYI